MGGEASFGATLRQARHAAGLTLEELAETSGVSVRALSDMERGRALGPQRRTVALIADALKLEGAQQDELVALAKAGRTRPAYLAAAAGLSELPGSIADFTGRTAEQAWIFRQVDALTGSADRSGAAVITGGAGMGKTTLVVRAAHHMRDRFPGGVCFVDALGMSKRPVAEDEILARVLRALGVRDQQIPDDTAERAGRYRQMLRDERVLVVVDDAASEAQVRPLLPGSGNSQLLVTSRRLLAGLEGVQRLHLDPMPPGDSTDLLRRILAERADLQHDNDLHGLVDLLGGLPLAVRIVGNRLVSRPIWSVADLTTRLSVAERRLDQLSAGDLKVAAAFGMSYEQLPKMTRQVFRRTALSLGPDFSAALAAATGEVTVPEAEDHLDDLVDLGLVEAAQASRYRLHDLVRLYAQQRLEHDDDAAAVAASHRRMVTWLLSTLIAAGKWFAQHPAEAAGSDFRSREEAVAWIRAEAGHWFPALADAAAAGDHRLVVQAVAATRRLVGRLRYWPHWAEVYLLGHDSAAAIGDTARQAAFLNGLARTHTVLEQDGQPALAYAEHALALARQSGDVQEEAWAWQNIGRARMRMGQLRTAMDAVRAAAELFEQLGDADAICQTLIGRGDIGMRLGEVDEALACFQRALEMTEDPASGMAPSTVEMTQPYVLGMTARALGQLGRGSDGVPLARQAAALFERMQMLDAHATALRILGENLYGDGNAAEAREVLRRAATIYESIGRHDDAADCRDKAAANGDGAGSS
ncbi:ATP-binding protein [Micromonospora sp. NBC_00858]|uniref:ATP-binding protein n=1 Tax=Micromonospora sp. NBC_00858 TaxID=2975979 RepID=UPI00386753AB|nr:helix-turn-helix domain-containing protein [Micromonospora sp. NBC_00858]